MQTITGPDDVKVEAKIEGDGDEAVVFVHSSASGIWQWKSYQQALADQYVTAAVHLYGYGSTSPWARPRAQCLRDQGRLIHAVVETLDRPVHLVGHSFGGAVALEASRQCSDVRSVLVYEPSLFWPLRSRMPKSWAEISAVMRAVKAGVAAGDLHAAGAEFVDYWSRDEVWQRLGERQQAMIASAMVAHAHEWDAVMTPPAEPDGWLTEVPAPTLVMTARDSPSPARDAAAVLTRDGHRRLAVLDRGGHMAPVTCADAMLAAVRAFVGLHTTQRVRSLS